MFVSHCLHILVFASTTVHMPGPWFPGEIYGIPCKRRKRRVGQDKVQGLRRASGQRRLRAGSRVGSWPSKLRFAKAWFKQCQRGNPWIDGLASIACLGHNRVA